MWRLWITIGWLAWALTIFASGSMNFLSGYGFGRNSEEAIVLALLGVAADGWKSIGPIFIVGLYRGRRVVVLTVAAIVWLACLAVAVTAAVGLIGQTRASISAERDAIRKTYETRSAKLQELLSQRANQTVRRSSSEIEAEINVLLAQPIVVEKRYRGTVSSVSDGCTDVTPRTAIVCAEIAQLRMEKVEAFDHERLTTSIDQLRDELQELTEQGASTQVDPQGDLIVRLSGGLLSRSDVPLALVLLVVVMVEVLSAFGPVVLSEFVASRQVVRQAATGAASRDTSREDANDRETDGSGLVDDIFEYMADRVRPAVAGRIARQALWLDYAAWCMKDGRDPTSIGPFTSELERICRSELQGVVRREGDEFVGCALAAHVLEIG